MYGGYFGAAQGVILLALLGITLDDDLQRLNGCEERRHRGGQRLAAFYFMASTRRRLAGGADPATSALSSAASSASHYGRRIQPDVLAGR